MDGQMHRQKQTSTRRKNSSGIQLSHEESIPPLYTLREMVLPDDELKIFNEVLEIRLEEHCDGNQ